MLGDRLVKLKEEARNSAETIKLLQSKLGDTQGSGPEFLDAVMDLITKLALYTENMEAISEQMSALVEITVEE